MRYMLWAAALAALLALAACGGGQEKAQDGKGLAGWERGSEYDKRYNPKELDRVKGQFQEAFEYTPMPGMAPGIGIVVRDRADDQLVKVHLGPKAFLGDEFKKFDLRPGQKVKITGAWVSFAGADVLMAAKVKKGEFEQLKVRRSADGVPYWGMTAEERAKEKAAEFDDDDDRQPETPAKAPAK